MTREEIKESVANALRGVGYIVDTQMSFTMGIRNNEGLIGSLRFSSVYVTSDRAYGHVEFCSAAHSSGVGRYDVETDGSINVAGLVRRLRSEIVRVRAYRAASKRAQARRDSDDAIRAALNCSEENEAVQVEVWNGLIDMKLTDLTPEVAARVLAVLKTNENAQ